MELSDAIHVRVKRLAATGDLLASARHFFDALERYLQAWDLLPEPKEQWEAATWLLAAIGDAHWGCNDTETARDHFVKATHCPGAIGNPFIHLRLGQCHLELGEEDHALDELLRAYMGAGAEIFDAEDEKYFEFVKAHSRPPIGGW